MTVREQVSSLLANLSDFALTYPPKWSLPPPRSDGAPHRLLILDSSFNPPTRAHVALLTAAQAHYPANHFAARLLLFATRNADKQLTGASAVQRLEMMEILAKKHGALVGVTRHARFVDKATHLQAWFGSKVELYFIMGYDTITRFLDPVYYEPTPVHEALAPFFQHARLVCADRAGLSNDFSSEAIRRYSDKIDRISIASDPEVAALSSTLARSVAKGTDTGKRLEDIVEDEVAEYIRSEHLYISKE